MNCRWTAAALLSLLLTGSVASHADDSLEAALAIEQTFANVIAEAESSVVSISRRSSDADSEPVPIGPFGRRRQTMFDEDRVPEYFGTGVVIARAGDTSQRFVLTNDHVLRGGRPEAPLEATAVFDVTLSGNRRVRGRVIAADPRSDLAVLSIDLASAGIEKESVLPLRIGDASKIRKGQLVLAMGNPYAIGRDGSASASWGIVSNISRKPASPDRENKLAASSIHEFGTLLHVDTRLDLGMSGGALLNLQGEVIGLTTSLAALRGYEKSVGYAIPIDEEMRRIIDDLLQGLEVEYGFLGIMPADAIIADSRSGRRQTSAARTMMVAWDSPADRAGLHRGDFITAINQKPITSASDLMREIGLAGPETVATLTVWRPSERRSMALLARLGKWPVQDDSRLITTSQRHAPWRGMTIDYPTARRRLQTSDAMERYHRAVLVTEIAPESPAAVAGLRVGDFVTHVGNTPVETPAQFAEATQNREESVTLIRLDGSQLAVLPAKAGDR